MPKIENILLINNSTPTRYEAVKHLCASIICSRPVLLEGPPATGKTSLTAYLAKCYGKLLYRVNNTKDTTIQDYFGSYMPNGDFLYGSLSRAMIDGKWFVADEFDLAEPAVMNVLYPILEGQQQIIVPNTDKILSVHDGFRFFATQNGTNYIGRKQLPKTLRSRFLEIHFQPFTEKELEFIIIQRQSTESTSFTNELKTFASRIASTVIHFNRYIEEKQRPLLGARKLQLTMREVIKWIHRKQNKPDVTWEEHALRLFESRVPSVFYKEFIQCLKQDQLLPKLIDSPVKLKVENNQISLCSSGCPISYSFIDANAAKDLYLSSASQNFLLSLWRIFAAVDQHESVLLLGPTSYKSYLIKVWAKLMAKESNLCTITCSTSTETSDLIGSIRYVHVKLHLLPRS
jgi:midasin (ATPase involved in ribosome maturation)